MHRRLIAASLTLGLAFFTSQGSAQFIDFNGDNQAQDPMVRQTSCSCATDGAHLGRGGQIIAAASGGGCGSGPCGPGGCPTGDCIGECNFAPYGHCLYPSPCWGACKGPCCRTIVGEMLLDVRRWCSNRRRFGSLLGNAIGASDSGGNAVFCGDVGCSDMACSDVGCTDGGIIDGPVLSGGLLRGGVLRGGLLGGFRKGRLESDCGCESVGICSDDACSAPLEVTCGCEDTVCDECSDGCAGGADTCFQDILSPCRSRGLISRFGDILFGSKCDCGSCSESCFEADCGFEEVSCGVESAGCAAVTRHSVTTQVAAQDENAVGRSLTARNAPQVSKPVARSTTQSRRAKLASHASQVPDANSEDGSAVCRVRFDQQVAPTTKIRFRD